MTERRAFLILVAAEIAIFAWAAAGRRLPKGHDTFQLYTLQHTMLSNAVDGGGPAYWLPQVTQGTATNWPLVWQGGLVQCLYLLAAPLLAGANFIPLFWAALLVEELVFLGGIWRLARRRIRSPSALFLVGAAAAATCVWQDQIWHSFRAFYLLPLLLALIEEALENPRIGKAALAGNLFIVQSVGNLPYVPVAAALVTGLWLLSAAVVSRPGSLRRGFNAGLARALAAGTAALLGTAALAWFAMADHRDQLVLRTPGRLADGSTTVDSFITFAGYLNPVRFVDAAIGMSPSLDFTLFIGPVTLAMALLAVAWRPGRAMRHLLLAAAAVLLFSTGFLGLAAALAYYGIPLMSFYRHVGLAAPFAKIPLLLLGGIALDALARGHRPSPRIELANAGFWASLGLLAFGFAGGLLPRDALARAMLTAQHPGDLAPITGNGASILILVLAGAGCLLAAAAPAAGRSPRGRLVVLALHALLLFGWKVVMIQDKTHPCTPSQAGVQRLASAPYTVRRTLTPAGSERFRLLQEDFFHSSFEGRLRGRGEVYCTTDAYLHVDAPASVFRTNDWMQPVDRLMRAYAPPATDPTAPLSCWKNYRLTFPLSAPSAAKVVGLTEDKLQIFSAAHAATPGEMAAVLADPAYPGDVLLVEAGAAPLDRGLLAGSQRLPARPEVLAFHANLLRVRVRTTTPAWLYYADAWHPSWTATVNGAPAAVERANLAHKAVALPAGESIVEFRFAPPVRRVCWALLSINAAAWIVIAGFLVCPRRHVSEISPRDFATDP